MGVKEQIIFPEIDFDQVDAMRGMDIAVTTTARPTKKPRRCSKRSASRSATDTRGIPMAKTSMVNRDIKRTKLVKKHAAKRAR
jgi:hypothetical protein